MSSNVESVQSLSSDTKLAMASIHQELLDMKEEMNALMQAAISRPPVIYYFQSSASWPAPTQATDASMLPDGITPPSTLVASVPPPCVSSVSPPTAFDSTSTSLDHSHTHRHSHIHTPPLSRSPPRPQPHSPPESSLKHVSSLAAIVLEREASFPMVQSDPTPIPWDEDGLSMAKNDPTPLNQADSFDLANPMGTLSRKAQLYTSGMTTSGCLSYLLEGGDRAESKTSKAKAKKASDAATEPESSPYSSSVRNHLSSQDPHSPIGGSSGSPITVGEEGPAQSSLCPPVGIVIDRGATLAHPGSNTAADSLPCLNAGNDSQPCINTGDDSQPRPAEIEAFGSSSQQAPIGVPEPSPQKAASDSLHGPSRYRRECIVPAYQLPQGSCGPAVWVITEEEELAMAVSKLLSDPIERRSRGYAAAQGAAKLASGLVENASGKQLRLPCGGFNQGSPPLYCRLRPTVPLWDSARFSVLPTG
eukprot:gene6563-3215_t